MRVIQRNLVYVTGLNPSIKEEDLLATLRGEQYFGQYGKIVKIVVNKRTAQGGQPSQQSISMHNNSGEGPGLGVYVTFSNKNEAELCIKAVDGTQNGLRTLRYSLLLSSFPNTTDNETELRTELPSIALLTCVTKLA